MQRELAALRAETNDLRVQLRANQAHVQEAATLVRDVAASSARYGRAAHVALAAATWCTDEVKKSQNTKASKELLISGWDRRTSHARRAEIIGDFMK
eukprot:10995127-Alexandrium_andersonii.AAC.1